MNKVTLLFGGSKLDAKGACKTLYCLTVRVWTKSNDREVIVEAPVIIPLPCSRRGCGGELTVGHWNRCTCIVGRNERNL